LFIQKSGTAEKRGKNGNFPQKAEEVATLFFIFSICFCKLVFNEHSKVVDFSHPNPS
jgi:hypothetical protein